MTEFGVNAIVLPPGWETGRHYHERQQELYFVHRGELEFEFGDGDKHRLGPGALARVDPSTVRAIRNHGPDDAVYVIVGAAGGYVGRDGRLPEGEHGRPGRSAATAKRPNDRPHRLHDVRDARAARVRPDHRRRQAAVDESGVTEGMVLVAAMHITAAVWINDDEPGLHEDTLEWLDKVAPPSWKPPANDVARQLSPEPGDYRHHRGGEDNGDAHLKNLLVHHQVIVPITDGRLDLGPWQQIFYCEFDGRRRKRLVIKVLGD